MKRNLRRDVSNLVLIAVALSACEGAEESGEAPAEEVSASETEATWLAPEGPPDPALASRGEALFTERGCVACHKIGGGRLVGPDLAGIHERRDYAWFAGMVMNPDSMIREDAEARALYAEYATPMTDMNVSAEEIEPLWEHIRMQSEQGP